MSGLSHTDTDQVVGKPNHDRLPGEEVPFEVPTERLPPLNWLLEATFR